VLDRANGPDLHVKLAPSVPVTGGSGATSIDDVSVGTNVRVKYHLEANQPVAERIEIAAAPSGAVR
jgi:hypothetical protein